MNSDETIILYIILRESLHLDNEKIAHCVANAMQHIMLKYFMMQILAVKVRSSFADNDAVQTTTKWLASQSKKIIISVDDEDWNTLKQEFSLGKDIFCLKDLEGVESTLIFWPSKCSRVPQLLKGAISIGIGYHH